MRAKPRFFTKRNRQFKTHGPSFEAHSVRLLGSRLMPWQRSIMNVALEYDAKGLFRYRTVVVLIPRQQGKSSIVNAVHLGRGYGWPDQGLLALAQHRQMAHWHIIDQLADRLMRDPYDGEYAVRRTNGAERIDFFGTHSWLGIDAVTPRAGHGLTLDCVTVDEAWALQSFNAIQAMAPAMITRTARPPGTQMWVVSTEGVQGESPVLDYFVEMGRAAVDDPNSSVCYVEYSAPDGVDLYDERNWWTWMPALGFTVSIDAVRNLADTMPPDEFARAMCNRKTSALESVFPGTSWSDCGNEDNQPTGGLSASVDITPDRSRSCISVCGSGCVEIIEDRPGTDWLVNRMLELDARWLFNNIAIDAAGPALSVIGELEMRGLKITKVDSTAMKSACGRFYDGVMSQQLRHRNQPVLDDAVRAVKRRTLLDAFAWSRKGNAYISPIVAATLAFWAWSEVPAGSVSIW